MAVAEATNQAAYERTDIVSIYANAEELFPCEPFIFDRYAMQFRGRVLDVAIGAGRTTKVLLPNARHYIGMDYSAGMIDVARERFPGTDLRVMDMRELPRDMAGQTFDAILISWNGIDHITWDDRNRLLAELMPLLAPNGVLVFSTHDLAVANKLRGFRVRDDLRIDWRTAHPRRLAKVAVRLPPWLVSAWANRRRNRHLEKDFDGYAYINDPGEAYALVITYVDTARQVQVLKDIGYKHVEIHQPWLRDEEAYFHYFVCSRGAQA